MTDREAMKRMIQNAYEARGAGDIKGLMSAFHPEEATFELAGSSSHLDIAGKVEGHRNLTESMTGFIGAFEFTNREITDWIIDGDRAAVRSRLRIKFTPTDHAFTTEVVDLFRLKDGKIVELVEFADTAHIKDVLAASPRK